MRGLILTKLVNTCELNFSVFRIVWISETLNVCFSLSYLDRVCILWLRLVCESLCVCVPCLRYPQKGKIPRVYYYYYKVTNTWISIRVHQPVVNVKDAPINFLFG